MPEDIARRCWTCHTGYTLEEFRALAKPVAGERQLGTPTALILRQCPCGNTIALPEAEVYPPDQSAPVVSLSAVREAKARENLPRIHVGTGADENQGRVWLTGEGDVKGWDVINDRLGWWLSPENAEALAGMLQGAAAKARGDAAPTPVDGWSDPVPGTMRITGQGQYFRFKEPIPIPKEHTVRFNPATGECEVVEPEPKEEP